MTPRRAGGLRRLQSLFAIWGLGPASQGCKRNEARGLVHLGAWPAGSTPQAGVITLLMLLLSQGHAPQAWKSWTCSPSCNETLLPRPQPGALITHLIIIFGESTHPHELLGSRLCGRGNTAPLVDSAPGLCLSPGRSRSYFLTPSLGWHELSALRCPGTRPPGSQGLASSLHSSWRSGPQGGVSGEIRNPAGPTGLPPVCAEPWASCTSLHQTFTTSLRRGSHYTHFPGGETESWSIQIVPQVDTQGKVAEPFPGGGAGYPGPSAGARHHILCEQEVLLGTSQSREGRSLNRGAEDVMAKG